MNNVHDGKSVCNKGLKQQVYCNHRLLRVIYIMKGLLKQSDYVSRVVDFAIRMHNSYGLDSLVPKIEKLSIKRVDEDSAKRYVCSRKSKLILNKHSGIQQVNNKFLRDMFITKNTLYCPMDAMLCYWLVIEHIKYFKDKQTKAGKPIKVLALPDSKSASSYHIRFTYLDQEYLVSVIGKKKIRKTRKSTNRGMKVSAVLAVNQEALNLQNAKGRGREDLEITSESKNTDTGGYNF